MKTKALLSTVIIAVLFISIIVIIKLTYEPILDSIMYLLAGFYIGGLSAKIGEWLTKK